MSKLGSVDVESPRNKSSDFQARSMDAKRAKDNAGTTLRLLNALTELCLEFEPESVGVKLSNETVDAKRKASITTTTTTTSSPEPKQVDKSRAKSVQKASPHTSTPPAKRQKITKEKSIISYASESSDEGNDTSAPLVNKGKKAASKDNIATKVKFMITFGMFEMPVGERVTILVHSALNG